MCGIAGELRFFNRPSKSADWDKISSVMARRGPDDKGTWTDGNYCTLVFRRLSIIDLSIRGHQPITAANERYALVFNGEVYNFMDLRKQLDKNGVQFYSTSDSEVVLQALIKWGSDALSKFSGMFALGFYDKVEKKLLLARDHAGIKPLYYLKSPDGIVFGSQYDQLLLHPWSRNLAVSDESLGLYLRLAYIPAPYALLENTHMLEPGMWIEARSDGYLKEGRFYTFPDYVTPTLKGDEAVDAVDEALTAAVKRHLVSDVPVGAFLSGGIDSPLVVAKMRSVCTNPIRTFTIGTGEDMTDESEDAKMYAQEMGVENRVDHISPDQALGIIDNVIDACGEPFGDYSMFPTLMVSKLARTECKVMLSGDGGDELFWGYPGRFGTLLKLVRHFRMPHRARKIQYRVNNAFSIGNRSSFLYMSSLGECHRSMLTHLPENFLNEIFPSLPPWPSNFKAFRYSSHDPGRVAQSSRWNEFVYHLTMVLMKVDRASMHHSLEVRVPFLDREVIEVATKIDWNDCLDLDTMLGKLPLRRSLARHIKYQTHNKRGFEVPMATWLRTSLKEHFEEFVLNRSDIMGLEINRKALNRIFDDHVCGKYDFAWGLWPLLSLMMWTDRHYKTALA